MSVFLRRGCTEEVSNAWFVKGGRLGLAADLVTGSLLVCADGTTWSPAINTVLQAGSEVGAGFFPALSGGNGAKVRCNFGLDTGRGLQLPAPARDYVPIGVAAAGKQVAKGTACIRQLRGSG